MNRVDTQLSNNRNQKRCQDNQRCTTLQEHTQNQKEDVDKHQHHVRVTGEVQHSGGNLLRNALPVQVIAKEGGSNDNQHNRAGAINGFLHNRPGVFPFQLLVDKGTDDDAINNSNSTCLGRGEHAHAQAGNNAKGEEQRPNGFFELGQDFADGSSFFTRRLIAALVRNNGYNNHHRNCHQNARHIACHKHFSYRYAGNQGIDDEVDARRNNRRAGRGGSSNSGTKGPAVAAFFHFGNQHLALHSGIGISTAGYTAHQKAQQHVYLRQAAGHMAHEYVSKLHQLVADTSIVHNRASHDEEGNC